MDTSVGRCKDSLYLDIDRLNRRSRCITDGKECIYRGDVGGISESISVIDSVRRAFG